MLDQNAVYGLSWLTPTRHVPSGAKRASGMLMRPPCPVTDGPVTGGDCAKAGAAAKRTTSAPPRGLLLVRRKLAHGDRVGFLLVAGKRVRHAAGSPEDQPCGQLEAHEAQIDRDVQAVERPARNHQPRRIIPERKGAGEADERHY